ncbi:hypothetical protein NUW58_g8894 [Xylaria curta]|uniref:Uncharacterized protein n=1 Tax=Xylaria curta TaxID=42375 RepID=A0ACC1N2V4_9PEZI|nr:hypothetical protein NUW58_g8894 [Xylaria curta]
MGHHYVQDRRLLHTALVVKATRADSYAMLFTRPINQASYVDGMNAIIHHASGVIMRRAIRDFGQNLVFEAKHEIASHLRPQDLDDIAPEIVKKFSNQFLDKALEYRLGTIDAQSLINALARAERLGYTKSDVIEDRKEIVVPTAQMHSPEVSYASLLSGPGAHPQPPPAAPPQGSLFDQPQPTRNASPTTELKCKLCWRHFKHAKPYEYHVQKQVCTKAAADASNHHFWCEECAAGFTTKAGLQYHTANAVCGSHATAAATPKSQATTPRSAALPPTNYAHHPPSQTQIPPTPPQPYSTPRRPNTSSVETPSSSQDDPYGHLTPERRAKLDEDLRLAELSYAPRFREAEDIADPVQRKLKIESLQNTFSTKQSMIRKKYGVRLRVRRTRAAIEEEKLRIGLKHGRGSPGSAVATPPAKRQRSDDASNSTGRAYVSHVPQTQTPLPTPTHPLSVSQMNNSGLNGSSATAAIADPTASIVPTQLPSAEEQAPSNSLSSLQRKGYRVSSHVGQATRPASNSPAPRASSAPTPAVVVLDDSSDSTDTDEEIPATLPQKRVS